MKSLARLFNNIKAANPLWSDYICFAEAIQLRVFSERTIRKHFPELVSGDDYDPKDKKDIVKNLISISRTAGKSAEGGRF